MECAVAAGYSGAVENKREHTDIDALADRYFQRVLDTSPETVTFTGLPGAPETKLDDYSPAGIAAHMDNVRETLAALDHLTEQDATDRVTVAGLRDRLGLEIELYEAGEVVGKLNVIESPVQGIRDVFDVMAQETASDWKTIAARLSDVPRALAGYRESLAQRAASGPAFAARQVERCLEQALDAASDSGSFAGLAQRGAAAAPELAGALEKSAAQARAAYGELAETLRGLLPAATENDAVGRDRYALHSREFLGAVVDLDETYEWGIHELERIDAEQQAIARELYGEGVSVNEALTRLDQEERYTLHGVEELRSWMQHTADDAMAAATQYFDIPEAMRTIECMIAPSNSGGIYYTGPSDDFSRPGRMWWSVPEGVTEFHTWQEKTTVYHEGVPGHHLQLGLAVYLKDQLNAWRRQAYWVSGHGEGWALYAEALMAELGFHEDPGDRMGVLDSERLRAARIVVDMGVHLGKDAGKVAGGKFGTGAWDHDAAWRFLRANVAMEQSFLSYELDRYLGWPGQASAYKVGARIWKELREEARTRAGAGFDLKAWHMKALRLGGVGLDVLRSELSR